MDPQVSPYAWKIGALKLQGCQNINIMEITFKSLKPYIFPSSPKKWLRSTGFVEKQSAVSTSSGQLTATSQINMCLETQVRYQTILHEKHLFITYIEVNSDTMTKILYACDTTI